jgi:DUF4097 and DUF4098 domain-containing protein YvlB
VRADLPTSRSRTSVSVDYEVFAPRQTDLVLRTTNGGVSVQGIAGRLEARTTNGSVTLREVAGDVRAQTTNGSVSVDLDGPGARTSALAVETTNGAITIGVPAGYSADLAASTEVGRISVSGLDLQDERRERGRPVGDRVEARLGAGGPRLSAMTRNGGITIRRSG